MTNDRAVDVKVEIWKIKGTVSVISSDPQYKRGQRFQVESLEITHSVPLSVT